MKFPERLKELRKDKQITQKELAIFLNLTANCICEWEKGRSEPNSGTLLELSNFFNVSVDYLLGREDDLGNVVLHSDPADILTKDEKRLIAAYRKLVPNMKTFLLNNAEMLAAQNG